MRTWYVFISIIGILLAIASCTGKKEEAKIVKESTSKQKEIEDVEFKNWIKALEEQPYKIEINKLKNPFVDPEALKLATGKKEKIPLELVGILEKEGKRVALLQDNNKKGYIVKAGTKIGNLEIVEIGSDYVIIEEEETTIYGEKVKNKRILHLKKGRIS